MKVVGVIGGGNLGHDPFSRASWSGSSIFLFREMQKQGILHRAFGVEVPKIQKMRLMAMNFATNRRLWRARFYGDTRYCVALTETVKKNLLVSDLEHGFFQIGAMFNLPMILLDQPCFSYHDGNKAQSIRSPYSVVGLSKKRIKSGLAYERDVYHAMNLVFAMSEYLRESFISDFDLPAEKVINVGGGVNLEKIPEYNGQKNYSTKDVLFIGVEFERKGGKQLLEAFSAARGRHAEAILHIVGPRNLKIPANLSAGVVNYGYLRKDDAGDMAILNSLFRKAVLYVMPSLYEPFGIAPLEAMTHQIPCLVTNRWALKEMVTPGENGDLCECGDQADLAEKLISLLEDPDRLRCMGEVARQRALDRYTWPRVVNRIGEAIKTHVN